MDTVNKWKQQFQQDIYADDEQVLDFQKDEYVVFYSCQQFTQELNNDGQSREEVQEKKL